MFLFHLARVCVWGGAGAGSVQMKLRQSLTWHLMFFKCLFRVNGRTSLNFKPWPKHAQTIHGDVSMTIQKPKNTSHVGETTAPCAICLIWASYRSHLLRSYFDLLRQRIQTIGLMQTAYHRAGAHERKPRHETSKLKRKL